MRPSAWKASLEIVSLLLAGCVSSNPASQQCDGASWIQKPANSAYFKNTVLAKAFYVYVEMPKGYILDRAKVIEAFNQAITQWLSGLNSVKEHDNQLKAFMDTYLMTNGGGSTLTPPLVLLSNCSEKSNFIVRFSKRAELHARRGKNVIAIASFEGRTIVLNAEDFTFYVSNLGDPFSTGKHHVNLTGVLAHELGHCFGLEHNSGNVDLGIYKAHNIMGASIPREDRWLVNANDASKLSLSLRRSVKGLKPGELDYSDCRGLLADSF